MIEKLYSKLNREKTQIENMLNKWRCFISQFKGQIYNDVFGDSSFFVEKLL